MERVRARVRAAAVLGAGLAAAGVEARRRREGVARTRCAGPGGVVAAITRGTGRALPWGVAADLALAPATLAACAGPSAGAAGLLAGCRRDGLPRGPVGRPREVAAALRCAPGVAGTAALAGAAGTLGAAAVAAGRPGSALVAGGALAWAGSSVLARRHGLAVLDAAGDPAPAVHRSGLAVHGVRPVAAGLAATVAAAAGLAAPAGTGLEPRTLAVLAAGAALQARRGAAGVRAALT